MVIVDSMETLLSRVDVVLLTSVDGRPHLAHAAPVFKAGKRVFIDKPLTASLDDVRRIVALSAQTRTPFFTGSSVRERSRALYLEDKSSRVMSLYHASLGGPPWICRAMTPAVSIVGSPST